MTDKTGVDFYDIYEALKARYEAGKDTSNLTVYLTKAGKESLEAGMLNRARWTGTRDDYALASLSAMSTMYGDVNLAVLDDDAFVVVAALDPL